MRRLLPLLLLAAPAASLAPGPAARAQTPALTGAGQAPADRSRTGAVIDDPQEVVVTATRVPTLAERVPAGVSVIDRAAIEARGYTTLTEALAAVPGLRVVQSGGSGGNASVFVRGTNSNHVLVLRDGLQVNDPADPGGAFNFGVDTLEDVERIEVVRGPMSGLYGSGAIGGVVNLITRRGQGPLRGQVEAAGGLPRAVLGRAFLSGSSGIWDYSASLESRSDRGFDVTPKRELPYTGERDGFRAQLATINLGVTPVEGTRAFLLLRGRRSVFGYDTVGSPSFDDPNATGRDSAFQGRVGVTSTLWGRWETGLVLGRSQTDRRFTNLPDAADPNLQSDDNRYHGRRHDVLWNNTVRLPDNPAATDAAFTFGYQHLADQARVRVNSGASGFPFQQEVRAHGDSDAGYAGVQGTFLRRLTLTGQLRQEGTTLGGDAFTWRAGGVLAVPEAWLRFKAAYGTAFRAPSLFDRYGVDNFGYVGNPALRPERSQGYELGAAVDVPLAGRADWASLSVTYFSNRIRDLIQFQFQGAVSTVANVARASSQGVEAILTLRPARWLEADLTYTYTDTKDRATGARLLRRPLNAASGAVRVRPLPGLTITPELLYTGAFQDYLVADQGLTTGVGRARAGLIANLAVTYDVAPKLALYAYGRNLGGSRFEAASGYQVPGTSVLLGTRVRF